MTAPIAFTVCALALGGAWEGLLAKPSRHRSPLSSLALVGTTLAFPHSF